MIIRFSTEHYGGYHTSQHANIVLMGKPKDFPYKMNGAVTDVNIFSRILGEEEAGDWARCRGQPGDILDWSTAQLNITKLETKEVNQTEGCYEDEPTTLVSSNPPGLTMTVSSSVRTLEPSLLWPEITQCLMRCFKLTTRSAPHHLSTSATLIGRQSAPLLTPSPAPS